MANKLTAIYYPDCYPADRSLFAAMCLYFQEVHFVSVSGDALSKAAHTDYLARLEPKGLTINVIGDATTPEAQRDIKRAVAFYSFVLDAKPLLGDVVHYHPNLQTLEANRITKALMSGGLPVEEFERMLRGETAEAVAIAEFTREHPEFKGDVLSVVLPTARALAIEHGYVPVSDRAELPAPVVSRGAGLADTLASATGLAILDVALPAPLWTSADDLLEVRHELHGDIEAYRLFTLKLAGRLRAMLGEQVDARRIREEADFLAKTDVVPFVSEVRRRIESEQGKLWRRVFGKTLKWLSVGLTSYMDPTGSVALKAMKEAGDDLASLTESAHTGSAARDPGISFLFKLEARNRDRNATEDR